MIPTVNKDVEKYLRDVELRLNRDPHEENTWFAKTKEQYF